MTSIKNKSKSIKEKKNNGKLKTILLILITTLITASGQVFFKLASKTIAPTITGFILNYYMWLGFLTYGLGLLLVIITLKKEDLSTAYPLLSLSFIWVILASYILFKENITTLKLAGTALIFAGVIMLNKQIKE